MINWKIFLATYLMLAISTTCTAAAFMKLGDIKGEATDNEHKDWIIIESMSSPLLRAHSQTDSAGQCQLALPERGDTTLGDVVVVKELDKSSPKIQQASCEGEAFVIPEVTIDLVASKNRGRQPYLRYKLTNVIVTSYSVGPGNNSQGQAVPMEQFS